MKPDKQSIKFLSLCAAFLAMAQVAARAEKVDPPQKAIVNASACNMYSKPDYESSLETQELMGSVVEIIERDRYWVKINTTQPYTAWTNALTIKEVSQKELDEYGRRSKYIVTALWDRVLCEPDENSRPLTDIVLGDKLVVAKKDSLNHFVAVRLPDGREGWVKRSSVMSEALWLDSCRSMTEKQKAEKAVEIAHTMVGFPYLWGGMTPKGMDCSGLVRLCYMMAGIYLPRNASQMFECLPEVPASQLKKGDLLFFGKNAKKPGHVAIFIGNGRFIQASQIVRINSLYKGEPDCYVNADLFIAARRPFPKDVIWK